MVEIEIDERPLTRHCVDVCVPAWPFRDAVIVPLVEEDATVCGSVDLFRIDATSDHPAYNSSFTIPYLGDGSVHWLVSPSQTVKPGEKVGEVVSLVPVDDEAPVRLSDLQVVLDEVRALSARQRATEKLASRILSKLDGIEVDRRFEDANPVAQSLR